MGVLALLAAILVVADPASAQSDTAACVAGGAVSDAVNNPGLVSDCDTLLAARDTLAGSATLNWSASTPIRSVGRRDSGRFSAAGNSVGTTQKGIDGRDTEGVGEPRQPAIPGSQREPVNG